jgi:hypothetical protein
MNHFVLNTNALAHGKEDAIHEHPERERAPLSFYKSGEIRQSIAYMSSKTEYDVSTGEIFGLQTDLDLRGINLKVQLGTPQSKFLKIRTNYDTNVSLPLMRKLWPGGPYSFLLALILWDERVSKTSWLRHYVMSGEIGAIPEKRMNWAKLFEIYSKFFS